MRHRRTGPADKDDGWRQSFAPSLAYEGTSHSVIGRHALLDNMRGMRSLAANVCAAPELHFLRHWANFPIASFSLLRWEDGRTSSETSQHRYPSASPTRNTGHDTKLYKHEKEVSVWLAAE